MTKIIFDLEELRTFIEDLARIHYRRCDYNQHTYYRITDDGSIQYNFDGDGWKYSDDEIKGEIIEDNI